MVKIQILGTGCPKCQKLADMAEQAAQELGIPYELEKISDIQKIMEFGVMMTPALAINGKVKIMGQVPAPAQIKSMLQ